MQKDTKNWFTSWFDTDFYHILYKDRDEQEAKFFMDNLTQYLNLPEDARIRLPCGRGRHSVYLNELGYNVVGADLSANSIAFARKFENENLKFTQFDMRTVYGDKFDAVFNLFTSIGYFENEEDNARTIHAFCQSLNETGFAVIDFMNVGYIENSLIPEEAKTIEGITFHINRHLSNNYVTKDIRFSHQGKEYHFTERVKALKLQDFEAYIEAAGGYLLDIFGDYKLGKFHPETSERLILIFK